ncbi:MAG: hypothetical protein ACI4DP_03380 [Candidatus Ornithomonoglobus sp.]
MIEKVIEKITKQQEGKEGTTVWAVGEQLKDICKTTPGAAELVLQDLENKSMSIDECEKQIKARADELHKKLGGSSIGILPYEADKIIRKFYGLPDMPEAAAEHTPAPAEQKPKKNNHIAIDFGEFFK